MPHVKRIAIRIKTTACDQTQEVKFEFNGHELPFENVSGGMEAGQQFEGDFCPNSFAHSVALVGPSEGHWEISSFDVTYEVMGGEPYTIHFGNVKLDEETSVDIWQEPALPTFDV